MISLKTKGSFRLLRVFRNTIFSIFCSFLLFFNILKSELFLPKNNSILNYIHVLFEWSQIPDALSYNIQISSDNSFSSMTVDTSIQSLIYINKNNIKWDSNYFWRIRPNFVSDEIVWSETFTFSTGGKRSEATTDLYNQDEVSPGLTIFGSFYNYFSAMIDVNGKEIWNTGDKKIVYYNSSPALDLLGCYSDNSLENNLPGVDFSLDNDFIWEEPNDQFLHHDIVKLPNGNYMGIVATSQLGPIPIGPWTSDYQGFGFAANGLSVEFPWVGDKLVEWDKDTKEVLWSWSVFDHFSMEDFDGLGGTWLPSSTGYQEYDWTHVNAMIFSEQESAIYISTRHLSRITKISYPSGEVIWNMGRVMPSGEVTLGNDLGFSFQHGLQKLENGNIVTFDNGNLSQYFLDTDAPISRALEIAIVNDQASITWEHSLSEDLFGFASGNAQKLENGNYLITTVGGNGTSIEVNDNGVQVWKGNYNLCEPICAVYRSNRVSSLYPIAFSLISNDLSINLGQGNEFGTGVSLPLGNASISFTLKNEGSISDIFNYEFSEELNWFENYNGYVELLPGEEQVITFNGVTINSVNSNYYHMVVVPTQKPSLSRTVINELYISELSLNTEGLIVPKGATLSMPFPNPFNSFIHLNVENVLEVGLNIDIYDINGKTVSRIPIVSNSSNFHTIWNAESHPSGLYFLSVSNSANPQFKKILYLK